MQMTKVDKHVVEKLMKLSALFVVAVEMKLTVVFFSYISFEV